MKYDGIENSLHTYTIQNDILALSKMAFYHFSSVNF